MSTSSHAELASHGAELRPLVIEAIRQETDEAKTFVLRAEGPEFQYQAGQHLTLVHQQYGREVRRSYSFSSSPELGELPAITVKRVDNGLLSRLLIDRAQVGDQLLSSGVSGFFTLPDDVAAYQQLVLLGAGGGITPLYSLLKTALRLYPELPVLLVYSNRSPAHTIFRTELLELAKQHPGQLKLELLYSNDPDLSRARLHKQLLQQLVRQHTAAVPERTLAYTCGPLDYMRMCTYGLHELGVPLSHIRRELFNTSTAPVPAAWPPDTDPHRVHIRLAGREYIVDMAYPDTMLQAARRQGIPLPYSCNAGSCGSCTVRCLRGQVWMKYNEVLTDRETRRGLVLTCTGYPVGGDVWLKV